MSQFSQVLCKLQSLNMVYLRRLSDCIVRLRPRLVALIFSIFFFLSFFWVLTMKLCVKAFSGTCELQSLNMAYIWRMSDCMKKLRLRLIAYILIFVLFSSLQVCMLILKNCVTVFSKTV